MIGQLLKLAARLGVMLVLALPILSFTHAQPDAPTFYFGVDLSYVNEMDDCGAVYRENGQTRDAFELFAEHGANLVRARLWHDPDWTAYSTLADVKRTFTRARAAGMETLLDIHYSDNWADAGTQQIPAAWESLNDTELAEAVAQYTTDVLTELAADGLTPAFVQVGNETNGGILKRGASQNWTRDATLFNAGIQAVREFSATTHQPIKILLHVAQPENTSWWFTQAEAAGITDFDMIGVSFYPQWSTFSIGDMGAQVTALRQRFGKEVMILETGYGWTRDAAPGDSADNVLDQGLRGYSFTPEGQRRFMTDLTQSLISNGASGVVYWEPAWVSTPCLTRWGQGSHWENATFFDFNNQNEVLDGINFLTDTYDHPASLVDGQIEADYGDAFISDAAGDVLNDVPSLDLTDLYIRSTDGTLSFALVMTGDILSREGGYLLYIDTTHDAQGADSDVGRRPITVADPFKPEFRFDISIQENHGSYLLSAWLEDEWQTITFIGGAAIAAGTPSTIEFQIPLVVLGNPQSLDLALVSADRGRARGASDILGVDVAPSNSEDGLILNQFFRFTLSE